MVMLMAGGEGVVVVAMAVVIRLVVVTGARAQRRWLSDVTLGCGDSGGPWAGENVGHLRAATLRHVHRHMQLHSFFACALACLRRAARLRILPFASSR